MRNLTHLVVGCGRSGTGFVSGLVQASGLRCGHEEIFDVRGNSTDCGLTHESSWYAAPFLEALPDKVKVLHVVRSPVKVVSSFHRIGLLSGSPVRHVTMGRPFRFLKKAVSDPASARDRVGYVLAHRRFLGRHSSILEAGSEIERLEAYWRDWNIMIENALSRRSGTSLVLRLEDIENRLEEISEFLELPRLPSISEVDRNEKSYRKRSIEDFEISEQTARVAKRFGYGSR